MLKHYFLISIRNLSRQKGLTLINILGLSIGIACFLLFLLYAINEFSFDRFHKNEKSIFRVYRWTEAVEGRTAGGDVYMPMPLGPAMKQDIPDVLSFVRLQEPWDKNFVNYNNQVSRVGITFADKDFLNVFSFKLISGNTVSPLQDLHNIVLNQTTATRLFGKGDAIGKTITIKIEDSFEPFVVSAIAEDMPSNSSLSFDALLSYDYLMTTQNGSRNINNWRRASYQTFVQLKPNSNLVAQPKILAEFRKKYYPEEEKKLRESGAWKGKGAPLHFGLQPLRAMHTDTRISGGSVDAVDPKNIWILLAVASAVLLIACINFTTLAIGRSAGRAKEVGVRKVIGGNRKGLISQFLTEALLLTMLSTILGLLTAKIFLPWFNQLSGRELAFSLQQYPELLVMIIGLIFIVGLLAGSYPAFVLSGFKPVEVLKSRLRLNGSNAFTKSLVTLQFVLSTGLIISTLIILQQLKFMRTKNPGFNKENIVVVSAEGTDTKKIFPLFKQSLKDQPEILAVSGSELGIGEGTGWSRSGFEYEGKHKSVYEYFVDADYLDVMGITLLAGRNFNPAITSDTQNAIIVNEEMVKDFGWTNETAIGQQLKDYDEKLKPVVIGVVKNFNFRPLSESVKPQIFHQFSGYLPYKFFVRIQAGDPSTAIAALNKSWKNVVADLPLQYSFLDEDINRFYKSEERWGKIIGWAGGVCIFLACLGLLGLAALAAINRTREIGIRKVLGASVSSIITLLSKDFLKLVCIALIIAVPFALYFMDKWLQDFAYRISINVWIFIITGISAILIAFITVGFQAFKTAVANPVKSLRSE